MKNALGIAAMLLGISLLLFTFCKKSGHQQTTLKGDRQSLPKTATYRTSGVEVYTNTPTMLIVDYETTPANPLFSYTATTSNSVTMSTLVIENGQTDITVTFTEDATINGYRWGQHLEITALAELFRNEFTSTQIATVKTDFETFLKQLHSMMEEGSLPFYSLYFHNAVISTISRSFSTQECNCTTTPMAMTHKTAFWCMEDFEFNTEIGIAYLDTVQNKSPLDSTLLEYLVTRQSETEIPFIDVFGTLFSVNDWRTMLSTNHTYFQTNPTATEVLTCPFGWGTEYGCCGNYDFCCLVWTKWCYNHDVFCEFRDCHHWSCLINCINNF